MIQNREGGNCPICGKPSENGVHASCAKQASESQCKGLNETFYRNWPDELFSTKNALAVLALVEPEILLDQLKAGVKWGKLQLAWGDKDDAANIEKLKRWAKIEIAASYYHAAETLMRLFIAHIQKPPCPWLEMASLRDFSEFKTQVNRIAKMQDEDLERKVAYAFLGFEKYPGKISIEMSPEKWNEAVKNIKEDICFYAKSILDNDQYNAYKHGLGIFLDNRSVRLGDIAGREGDSLLALVVRDDEEGRRWAEKVFFFDADLNVALTYMAERLLGQVIETGRARYIRNKPLKIQVPSVTIGDILKANRDPIHIDSFTMDLWPLVPHQKRKRKQ